MNTTHHVIARMIKQCLTHDLHREIVTRTQALQPQPASLDEILVTYWHNPDKVVPNVAFDIDPPNETHATLTHMSSGVKIVKTSTSHLVLKDVPSGFQTHATNFDRHAHPSIDWVYSLMAKWSADVNSCPIDDSRFRGFLASKIANDMAQLYPTLAVPKRSFAQTYYLFTEENAYYARAVAKSPVQLTGHAMSPTGWLNGISRATAMLLSKQDRLRPPITKITRPPSTSHRNGGTHIGAVELNLAATADSFVRAAATYVACRRAKTPSPLCVEMGHRILTQLWFPVNCMYNAAVAGPDLRAIRGYVAVKRMLGACQPTHWWIAHNAALSETLEGMQYFTKAENEYAEIHRAILGEFVEYELGRSDAETVSQELTEAFAYDSLRMNEDHFIAAYRAHSAAASAVPSAAVRDSLVLRRKNAPRVRADDDESPATPLGSVFVTCISIPPALHPHPERRWMSAVSRAVWTARPSDSVLAVRTTSKRRRLCRTGV